jgi:trehalose 6-phosphate synthase
MAQVGLVTPFHDGMNLVAKEYVAAQNPADPGVLVLSEFAGAAKELDAALLVNPHDVDGMARAFARALQMSGDERRARWSAMLARLRQNTGQMWFEGFVKALDGTRLSGARSLIPAAPAATALPYRPERTAHVS